VGGTTILSAARLSAIGTLILAALAPLCSAVQAAESPEAEYSLFPVRIVEIETSMPLPAFHEQLEFYAAGGFNAFWVSSEQAGKWSAEQAPAGPVLEPRFLELVRWCENREIGIYVSVKPYANSSGSFTFTNKDDIKRLHKFCRLLQRQAGIHNFVLSFMQAPLRLSDVRDIVRYGLSAAPAHLALAAALQRRMRGQDRLWLTPAVSSDFHLYNPHLRYSSLLLTALQKLDRRIGIVWSGPAALSPAIGASELEVSRSRLGGRPLLLQDRCSFGPTGEMISLAVALGPLRNREPAIARHIDGYLYRPMSHRGGSRLAILTVADFLKDPHGYDPESSWTSAMEQLTGDHPAALKALKTQAMEWGGWIQARNYRSVRLDNPLAAAERLNDPAAVARWRWTARRYPERMADLAGLKDDPFREDLLDTMARRYAVARAMPTVRELRTRLAAGRSDTAQLVEQLRNERTEASSHPGAKQALDRFLAAAGLASIL
jgi:hypothetical protein